VSAFEFVALKPFEQYPSAALERPYFFVGSIRTSTPPDLKILVDQEDITDS